MAFTETEKGTLCEILDVTPSYLDLHLDSVVTDMTTEVEDLIQADIVLWATYRNDRVRATAGPAGFKGLYDAELNRSAIRKRVTNWLEITTEFSGSGLVRG